MSQLSLPEHRLSRPTVDGRAPRRLDRRSALRLWATLLAASALAPGRALAVDEPELPTTPSPEGESAPTGPEPERSVPTFELESGSAYLRLEFDPEAGRFAVGELIGFDTAWVPEGASTRGALWLAGVEADGQRPITIDGSSGLELVSRARRALSLYHPATGLQVALEYSTERGSAITHRATLSNARSDGEIFVKSAVTLALPLWVGDWTEALAADGTEQSWSTLLNPLPVSYGNHELRNATGGVYPLIRLATPDGDGMIIAVSTATAWRVDVGVDGGQRLLRAGEYQSDLLLRPGERARLPDVVTIFYRGGRDGAKASLHRYLESVSLPPPSGWERTPPTIFNTWFAYGTDLVDSPAREWSLRWAARNAAEAGVEVFVVDAGWYRGNPIPDAVGNRGQAANLRARSQSYEPPYFDDDDEEEAPRTRPVEQSVARTADDFTPGLGTWLESRQKWQADAGIDGNRSSGLRNFSDFVHSLDVPRQDGSASGKMRFGLWIEPERFDRGSSDRDRVPRDWRIRGTTILDFSRPEVVDGITRRIQNVITSYRVDYLKIDANRDVTFDEGRGRSGHFWTLWSQGFERFLTNLRRANSGLFIEHCASGLQRYWIGLARLAHANWLDDDISLDNVGFLLDACDALMLPRQKTVLVTEDLASLSSPLEAIRAYWGGEHRNGGVLGFSSPIEQWGGRERRAASEALDLWKLEIRDDQREWRQVEPSPVELPPEEPPSPVEPGPEEPPSRDRLPPAPSDTVDEVTVP